MALREFGLAKQKSLRNVFFSDRVHTWKVSNPKEAPIEFAQFTEPS